MLDFFVISVMMVAESDERASAQMYLVNLIGI
jgi:hypothetical protein